METAPRKTRPKQHTSLITFLIFFALFVVINIWMMASFILPVLMGAILAILAYPLFQKAVKRHYGPQKSAFALTIGILLLVILPLGTFGALAVDQAISIGQQVSGQEDLKFSAVVDRVGNWAPVRTVVGDPAKVRQQANQALQSAAKATTGVMLKALGGIPLIGLHLVLSLIACYFFLVDGQRFVQWMSNRIPVDNDVKGNLLKAFRETTISTIWATLAAAAVQGAMMCGAYLALGVPGALLAAGATFIFAWIPVLGSTPVWVVGAIYLYVQDSVPKAIIMIVLGIITSVADNLVRPLVLKGRGDMHPLVALVAIFGGIEVFGIFGVFYGPILVATLTAFLYTWPLIGARFGLFAPTPKDLETAVKPPLKSA